MLTLAGSTISILLTMQQQYNYAGEVISVTPAMAESWLKIHAKFQRPLSDKKVAEWVRLMHLGQFKLTHQGIAITNRGEILDGQHRLAAIAKSGITREMVVTLNADPTTFDSLDRGYTRSNLSVMRIQGFDVGTQKLSALNTLLWIPSVESSLQRTWSIYDLPEVAEYFSYAMTFVFTKGSQSKFNGGYIRGAGLRAIASNPGHAEKVARFYYVLSTGESCQASEVLIARARRKLEAIKSPGQRDGRWRGYWITIHALKAYLSGTDIKHEGNIGNTTFMQGGAAKAFPSFLDEYRPHLPWSSIKKPTSLFPNSAFSLKAV